MNRRFLHLSIAIIFTFLSFNIWAQSVSITDSLALVDFYDSANGAQWQHTHWDLSMPVNDWEHVEVDNGRVAYITIQGEATSGGIIPSSFGNLTALRLLILDGIKLTDTLPASFANLTSLYSLQLTSAFYNLPFPAIVTRMPNLEGINFDHCTFTDTIPSSIGNLPKLDDLILSFCNLSGKIPSEIGNCKLLTGLDLNSNNLSGPIPASIVNLTSLNQIVLDENNLSGPFPLEIADFPALFDLSITNNAFTFQDMEPLAQKFIDNNYQGNFFYDPQARISVQRKGEKLWVSPGGTLSKNTFQWHAGDGSLVATIIGDSTYVPASTGKYYALVNNSVAIDLTLYSDTARYDLILPDTTTTTVQNISGTDTTNINKGIYRLVSLKPLAGTNALTGNVAITESIDSSISTFQGKPYVQRHYDITPALNAGTSQAVVVLYFSQQDFDNFNNYVTANNLNLPLLPSGGVDNGNVRITQLHGSFTASPDPANYDTSNNRLITPNVTWDALNQWWVVSFSVDGFSGFFLSTANITLPLSLIDFKGVLHESYIALNWTTANEVGTKQFVVQRGNDGKVFSDIGIVSAVSTATGGNYQFNDFNPSAGNNFYRLKMLDIDGRFSFSPIIKINSGENISLLKIYPNPGVSVLSLQFALPRAEKIAIEITDAAGKTVLKATLQVNTGTTIIPLNIQKLSAGVYYLNAHVNGGMQRIAFVKK